MFVEVQGLLQLKMAFSIIELLTRIAIGLIVGGIIAVPIVIIIWKLKMRKIKKDMPENMEKKVKEFKINERRVEDEKRNREDFKKTRRNQRAADAIKSDTWNSVKDLGRGGLLERSREIPKTTPSFVKRTKSDSKGNWPSFE